MSEGEGISPVAAPSSDIVRTPATPDRLMVLAKVVALFCAVGAGAYAAADVTPMPLAATFLFMAPPISVILWLERDTHRTGVGAVHDLGFLLWPWFTSVSFIPWYAWKTRGRAGWRLTLLLFVLMGASGIGEVLGLLLVNVRPSH